jgi:hypothetical protein
MLQKKRQAGKISGHKISRDQSLAPKRFWGKEDRVNRASAPMGTAAKGVKITPYGKHTDVTNSSVQGGITRPTGSVGTTVGSSQPSAPDQASVLKGIIRQRAAKPPAPGGNPPPSPTTVASAAPGSPVKATQSKRPLYQNAQNKLRRRGGFR